MISVFVLRRTFLCYTLQWAGRAAATDEIAWYVALLYTPLCCARTAAPCWPAESWALRGIAAARAEIMSCCNGHCTAAALNLHRCPLFLPSSGESMVRGNVTLVLCTTRLVSGGGRKPTTCALRCSGVKSISRDSMDPLNLFPHSSDESMVRGSVALVLCTTRLVSGGRRKPTTCAPRRSRVKSIP